MAKRNSFKKGTIELLTLAILQDGDCYGYQITQSICDKSNGIITVTEGALYPILYRLVEAGVIYFHELLEEYNQVKLGVELILSQNQSSSEIAMGGENIEQKN